ncbi:hypothetical protein BN8_01758 [Fibrisoma limi BUZ 3]|uniref:Uncharacterized protein n=1 Tax=Fibrisoma limi BUZ 3 TaxID=1185876 RepID=I2GFR1_9BACT|nr:hypothetical protein [Fibrisoma limi]CCH52736.1 hypothetical protein BN8_01758 [Fibrisoma limi BUZ 3]
MLLILYRTLISTFYAQNAGFFLVVVLIAFGFMRPIEHEALIAAALGSPLLLALATGLWVLYTLKTTSFVRQQLRAPEHLFLQTFWLLPKQRRWGLWLLIQLALLLPILSYAGWMLARGIRYEAYGAIGTIVGVQALLLVGGVWANDYRLRHPNPEGTALPRLSFRLPYVLFFPMHWLRHEPVSMLLTKAFSGLLLAGVCRLYPTDDYDQRLLLIGLVLSVATHAQVGGQVSAFEHRYLLFLQNLPLAWYQRLGRYTLTYGLIWLPELLILLRNCPAAVGLDYVVWLWLTGWGWLLLMHALSYASDRSPDRWLTGIMIGVVVATLTIMFGLPVGAWLAIGWLGAVGYWYRFTAPLH